jgi:hypothetical protein
MPIAFRIWTRVGDAAMEALAAGDVLLFDGFRLDRRGGGLFRRDERGDFSPLAIGSRALDVLGVLIDGPSRCRQVVSVI